MKQKLGEVKNWVKILPKKTLRFLIFSRIGNLVFILFSILVSLVTLNDIRLINRLSSYESYPISTQILDRNDKLIYEIFADERRTLVKLKELPPNVLQATIAIEDKDFYKHIGISPAGIARAFYSTFFQRRLQGGSTITQQLVKNALLTPERTIFRKIHEFYLALVIEVIYPKDKILELYLNQVPYGGTAWGVEAAAQTYFGKGAKDLTLSEAALIAGLPAAPTPFSPFGANPNLAKDRQAGVLRRMVEDGYITEKQAEQAKIEELAFKKPQGATGIHFALLVKEALVEEFGERMVEQGGLRVRTTLDLGLQKHAEEIVKTEVDHLSKQKVKNGAALVTHPGSGEILAMVGSKDYFAEDEDGNVNVTIAARQPGSSIKPINYALGLYNGTVTPASIFLDTPTCFNVQGQPLYCPENYDGSYRGPVELRYALANSLNVPAVKMLAKNGVPEFVTFATRMGLSTIQDPSRYGLSLTLGGGEVKMTDMAQAFGVFANEGEKQELVSILEVKDWKGKTIKKYEPKPRERVITPDVAFLISDILSDNAARSSVFGTSSYLNVSGHPEVSVKTGTTNDRRDNWTIGYTKDAVAATWVGNNDNTPMSGAVSGVSGASPIWNRIIKTALDKMEAGEIVNLGTTSEKHDHPQPAKPGNLVKTGVCSLNGSLPAEGQGQDPSQPNVICPTRTEYFLDNNIPKGYIVERRTIHIDKTNGQMVTRSTPQENMELQERSVLFDILGSMYCIDCTPLTEPQIIGYPLEVSIE